MRTYSEYLSELFPGGKVQKISVNAGFSCPNRDGSIGTKGCDYCRNDSFTPSYCMEGDDLEQQIAKGKEFFRRKYPEMRFIVYFQSYTNTYGSLSNLESLYRRAMKDSEVVGLAIGTRPDTLPDDVLGLMAELNREKPILLEIGAETSDNRTLSQINRRHTWEDVEDAVRRASRKGLHCGLHLIAGLPGETHQRIIQSVEDACRLPIDSLKIHQLQILKGTVLEKKWIEGSADFSPFTLEDYLVICRRIMQIVPDHIVIERWLAQSPPELVVAPKWGLKNYQFTNMLNQIKDD